MKTQDEKKSTVTEHIDESKNEALDDNIAEANIKSIKPIIMNILYAITVLAVLSLFYLDFFRVSLYGEVSDKEKGFEMALILFGNGISKNEMLAFIAMRSAWKIQFASITTVLCIIALLALFSVFVIRAVLKKPATSKLVFGFVIATLTLLIIQFVAYFILSRAVTSLFYDPCCMGVTYSGGSFAFAPLLLYIAFYIAFHNINKKKVKHEN